MVIVRIAVLVCLIAPSLSRSQTSAPIPFSPSVLTPGTGLLIRKSAYRTAPPKRFAAPLFVVPFLSLHQSPPDGAFVEQILLGDGAFADADGIWDTEFNLRSTGLFSRMETRLDTIPVKNQGNRPSEVDVALLLYERPSFAPFLTLETGGSAASAGFGACFTNIATTWEESLVNNTSAFEANLFYRSENAIGWQGDVLGRWNFVANDNVSPIRLEARIKANRFWNTQEISLIAPFSENQRYNEWSVRLSRYGGREFQYRPVERSSVLQAADFTTSPFTSLRLNATGIVSGSYWDADFYLNASVQADVTRRDFALFSERSLDNTVLGILGIGTEQRYALVLNEAFWGETPRFSAKSLGEIAPLGFYINGGVIGGFRIQSGQWYQTGWAGVPPVFLMARIGGATLLGSNIYTSFRAEFFGESLLGGEMKVHWALGKGIILATRLFADVPNGGVSIVDNDYGVRGYGANTVLGYTNKWVFNAELRGLPIGNVGQYKLTGTIFYDIGYTHGELDTPRAVIGGISYGAGVRLHYPAILSSNGADGVLRLDVAFVPQIGRFGQIILSTKEAFTLFDNFPARQERLIGTRRFVE
jgi:hypothetical protein